MVAGAEAAVNSPGSCGDTLPILPKKLGNSHKLVTQLTCLCWNLNLGLRICAFFGLAILSKMAVLNLNPSVNKGWYSLLTLCIELNPFGDTQVKREEHGERPQWSHFTFC